jgi:hypothetical protein
MTGRWLAMNGYDGVLRHVKPPVELLTERALALCDTLLVVRSQANSLCAGAISCVHRTSLQTGLARGTPPLQTSRQHHYNIPNRAA